MIEFEFLDGVKGSVHDGVWYVGERNRLRLVKAIADSDQQKDFYHLDADLYLVEEVLKIIPGKIISNDRPHVRRKGLIY